MSCCLRPSFPPLALALLALGLAAGMTGCERTAPTAPITGTIRFEEMTAQAGLVYQGTSFGAAWGDLDGDGFPDIWASGHAPYILYRNRGNGTFEEIGPRLTDAIGTDRHAAAWADFDRDGDEDLIQTNGGARGTGTGDNNLLVNDGGRLLDRGAELGVTYGKGRGRTPLWIDYDGDGRLDLLLNNYNRRDAPTVLYRQSATGFLDVTDAAGLSSTWTSEFTLIGHLDRSSVPHLIFGPPFPSAIYAMKNGRLNDETARFRARPWWATDATIGDLDGDLDDDLFAVRGDPGPGYSRRSPGELIIRLRVNNGRRGLSFISQGRITFHVNPVHPDWWTPGTVFLGAQGVHPAELPFTTGLDDPRLNGLVEDTAGIDKAVLVGLDAALARWTLRLHGKGWEEVTLRVIGSAPISGIRWEGRAPPEPRFRVRLLMNRDGILRDEDYRVGIGRRVNAFSVAAGDFDNDMDVDLYLLCSGAVANTENLLLENRGHAVFRVVESAGGAPGSIAGFADTVAVADYDLDGFLDLFVANGQGQSPIADGPHQLFHNRGNGNHWLEIDLVGRQSNREGIGARVLVTAGGTTQMRTQANGMHDRAQDFRRIHFGLGPNRSADRIRVDWPSGVTQILREIAADQILRIEEQETR